MLNALPFRYAYYVHWSDYVCVCVCVCASEWESVRERRSAYFQLNTHILSSSISISTSSVHTKSQNLFELLNVLILNWSGKNEENSIAAKQNSHRPRLNCSNDWNIIYCLKYIYIDIFFMCARVWVWIRLEWVYGDSLFGNLNDLPDFAFSFSSETWHSSHITVSKDPYRHRRHHPSSHSPSRSHCFRFDIFTAHSRQSIRWTQQSISGGIFS